VFAWSFSLLVLLPGAYIALLGVLPFHINDWLKAPFFLYCLVPAGLAVLTNSELYGKNFWLFVPAIPVGLLLVFFFYTGLSLAVTFVVVRVRRLRHAQEVKDVEPLGDLLTDQSRFFELQNALLDRDERIRELGGEVQKLRELGELVPHDDCYWAPAGDKWDGPFCVPCRDMRSIKARMSHVGGEYSGGPYAQCESCHHSTQHQHRPQPPNRSPGEKVSG